MSRIARLRSKLRKRLHRRDRQISIWKKDHKTGNAKAAKKDAHAVRFLRHLLGIKVRKREEERKHDGPAVMYDSVTVSEIPANAQAVAGYVGGSWPTYENGELREHCPDAHLVSIAVSTAHKARFLDIEKGDATPSLAPAWLHRELADQPKERPGPYGSVSDMQSEILPTLRSAGIKRSSYAIWTAHYGAGKHICGPNTCGLLDEDADATQWTDTSHGRNLDESFLRRDFFA